MPERVKTLFADSDSEAPQESPPPVRKRKSTDADQEQKPTGPPPSLRPNKRQRQGHEHKVINFQDEDIIKKATNGSSPSEHISKHGSFHNSRQQTQFDEAKGRLRHRATELQKIREQLPIWKHADEIRKKVKDHDVLLLVGETGSGKSTQTPQFLLPLCQLQQPTVTSSTNPRSAKSIKVGGRIAITQPRRVAAISLARRVAEEMGTPLGNSSPASQVGYSVRFDSNTSPSTRVKFLTDGMLLQELVRDPWLREYSVVVVDEVHERGVNVDLVLGFLKRLIDGRHQDDGRGGVPLKVVVMSATADMERIQRFFDPDKVGIVDGSTGSAMTGGEGEVEVDSRLTNAGSSPVRARVASCYVKGRQYPVTIQYTPIPVSDVLDSALERIINIHSHAPLPGDILVFLPGQETIDTLESMCNSYAQSLVAKSKDRKAPRLPKLLILPLFAALPTASQQRVFESTPPFTRKIILSTNIAETSVTVPGIRHVIDTGKRKARFFRPGLNLDTLLTKAVSRSSANQRAGRAGREAAGFCYRLYTEKSFYELEADTEPEILRCDLSQLVLTLKAHQIDNILTFPLLTPPPGKALERALLHLLRLDALDQKNGQITKLGHQMSTLPLPANLARVLLASQMPRYDCLEEIIDIVSGLSVENIWLPIHNSGTSQKRTGILRSAEETEMNGDRAGGHDRDSDGEEIDNPIVQARSTLYRRDGDHLTLLAAIQAYVEENADRKEWCRRHGISHRAMVGAMDVRKQLRKLFIEGNRYAIGRRVEDRLPKDGNQQGPKSKREGDHGSGQTGRNGKKVQENDNKEDDLEATPSQTLTTTTTTTTNGESKQTRGEQYDDDATTKSTRILKTLLIGLSENIAYLAPRDDHTRTQTQAQRQTAKPSSKSKEKEQEKETTIWTGPYTTLSSSLSPNSSSTRKNLSIHPSSVLFVAPSTETKTTQKNRPAYIMFSEFVVTGKAYARNVSVVQRSWLDDLES